SRPATLPPVRPLRRRPHHPFRPRPRRAPLRLGGPAFLPPAPPPWPPRTPPPLRQAPQLDSQAPPTPRPDPHGPAFTTPLSRPCFHDLAFTTLLSRPRPFGPMPDLPHSPSAAGILGEWISPLPSSAPCRRSPSTITSTAGCAPRPCSS